MEVEEDKKNFLLCIFYAKSLSTKKKLRATKNFHKKRWS